MSDKKVVFSKNRKGKFIIIAALVLLLIITLRGVYVSETIGPQEYAEVFEEDSNSYQIALSTTNRSSGIMAETPIATIFSLLEQVLFHPTATHEVIICVKSMDGVQSSDEIRIIASGKGTSHGSWEIKGLIGNISLQNEKLNVVLKHKTINSGSHYLLHSDGSFELNGAYEIRRISSPRFTDIRCG